MPAGRIGMRDAREIIRLEVFRLVDARDRPAALRDVGRRKALLHSRPHPPHGVERIGERRAVVVIRVARQEQLLKVDLMLRLGEPGLVLDRRADQPPPHLNRVFPTE